MSVQPVPPNGSPTTAGQLASRATANDQALAAALALTAARLAGAGVTTTDNGNGTGTVTLTVPSLEG